MPNLQQTCASQGCTDQIRLYSCIYATKEESWDLHGMNFLILSAVGLFLLGILPAFADVQNLQVFQNQQPLNVDASNPALIQVSPNSFLFGTLDTNNYPAIVCQLDDCLWQVDTQGYLGYHVRFSGITPNSSAIVKVSDFSIVFTPSSEAKPTNQEPSWKMPDFQNINTFYLCIVMLLVVGLVVFVKKFTRKPQLI